MAKLKWLWFAMAEVEPASFWYNSPEVGRGELSPDTIATEVFLFPAAACQKIRHLLQHTTSVQFHEKEAILQVIRVATPGSWFTWGAG